MIEWFVKNPVAANLLMFSIVVAGIFFAKTAIPLETFPKFDDDAVRISTTFRGATPNSVQDSVTVRVEESIYDIEGIHEISSRSSEGSSIVTAEVEKGHDKREILNDIKLRIDALNTLPQAAEKPVVSLAQYNPAVIYVVVMGETGAKDLRQVASKVRDDLLAKSEITLVDFEGVADYEISVEIPPQVLDDYNLTLAKVGQAIQRGSLDLSAGNIKTIDGDILVRTDGQAYSVADFAQIPVITNGMGDAITLDKIAKITDGFEEQPLITKFNGKSAVVLSVRRVGSQSAIDVARQVHDYIRESVHTLPPSVTLDFWDDDSKIVEQRLNTLVKSGVQGGILVLLLLSLFLRPAIAFWVFLGVPVSFMGAFIFMPFVDGTFNVISLFAFITVLGIVVDDAIVTGENIYRHMREGSDAMTAAIVGTKQIAAPVTFGILTTVVAFIPLGNLGSNRIGYLAEQIPMVVIPILLFSLIESKLVLPSHLSHIAPRKESDKLNTFSRLQQKIARWLEGYIENRYQPFIEKCLDNKSVVLAILFAVSAIIYTYSVQGHMRFTFFPRVESETITFDLTMPDTTGFATTNKHIEMMTQRFEDMREKYRDPETGESIIRHVFSTAGSIRRTRKPSIGRVRVEIMPPEERHIDISAKELARESRELIGEIPGAEKLSVTAEIARGGAPIDVQISGASFERMGEVVKLLRVRLKQYPNVFDIQDNYTGGKEELKIDLKPQAYALGLSLSDVASQIRNAVFGFQAQRIQRGRDELRVMVRYPLEYRSSLEDLYAMKIQVANSPTKVPLSDIAVITPSESPTTLYRLNRNAILNVLADVDKDKADVPAIYADLKGYMEEIKQDYPGLNYSLKGEAEEQADSGAGISQGVLFVLIAIYALLAIPFKSYGQPLVVMSVIPFSLLGAVLGHIIMAKDLSMLSIVGMLALVGVVVNDSLVLVDNINERRKNGMPVKQAVATAGAARFRPVLLTSLTTFAGLTPLLLDNSTQVQFLVQMAISLGFGIIFATAITLIFVPINYLIAYQSKAWLLAYWNKGESAGLRHD